MQRHVVGLIAGLALIAVALAGYFAGQREVSPAAESQVDVPVPDFSLTERSGRIVRRDDLLGKVWVASFVFTCCARQCPQVTGSMAQLNHELAAASDFRLVSFTVDPERDTPAVLKSYAQRYGADEKRWLFLTGQQDALYNLIEKGFLLAVKQNEGKERTPGNEVTHSFRLALVDRRGHVRGYFDGRRTEDDGQPIDEMPRLKQAIAALLREPS